VYSFIYITIKVMIQSDKRNDYIKEIMEKRYEMSIKSILSEYQQRKEDIDRDFQKVFEELFLRCATIQKKKEKGKIAVISIFILKTAVLTGTYELQINLYDENFYLDRNEIYALWVPSFVVKYYEEDVSYFSKKAKQNVYQFGYTQLQDFRIKYAELYALLAEQYCIKNAEKIISLSSFGQMETQEQLILTFGGYMDKGICIYPPNYEE